MLWSGLTVTQNHNLNPNQPNMIVLSGRIYGILRSIVEFAVGIVTHIVSMSPPFFK